MMAEDWAAIAAEVASAIAEVGVAATITRDSAGKTHPWDQPAGGATVFAVTVIDDGIRDFHAQGGLVTRRARVLTIAATGVAPIKADVITLRGQDYVIDAVRPLAPGGVDLLFEVEIES